MRQKGPMPIVIFEGKQYKLLSRKTVVPNLAEMGIIEARMWVMKHTRGRGYQITKPSLAGYTGISEVE